MMRYEIMRLQINTNIKNVEYKYVSDTPKIIQCAINQYFAKTLRYLAITGIS